MQEIRLHFPSAEGPIQRVALTDGDGHRIGVEVPFEPFLTDADYDELRWYLEEYIELPDGGAVVRSDTVKPEFQYWLREFLWRKS